MVYGLMLIFQSFIFIYNLFSLYVSLRSEFRVVVSVTNSA